MTGDATAFDPIRAASVLGSIVAAIGGFEDPAASAPSANPAGATTTITDPTATTGASDAFVDPSHGAPINSPFGARSGGFHPGIDLGLPDHSTVLAAMQGTVIEAVNSDDPAAYNVVKIQHANGIVTEYGHLSGVNVKVGDQVSAGQVIGASGGAPGERGTYNSSGPHLHFQVDLNGQPVDPAPYLAGAHPIVGDKAGAPLAPTQIQVLSPEQVAGAQISNVVEAMAGQNPHHKAVADAAPTSEAGQSGSTLSGATSGADGDPGAVDAFLAATRTHESGGNYASRYQGPVASDASGAYGFLSSTYHAYGGTTAQAYQASPEEQDAVARRMAMQLFNQFHSWRLVAIAWYGGPGVAEQVARGQDPGSPSGQGGYLAYGDTIAKMMGGGG